MESVNIFPISRWDTWWFFLQTLGGTQTLLFFRSRIFLFDVVVFVSVSAAAAEATSISRTNILHLEMQLFEPANIAR